MSTTSTACQRCGRLDYPHVCQPFTWPNGETAEPMVAHETQMRVTYEWIDFDKAKPDQAAAVS